MMALMMIHYHYFQVNHMLLIHRVCHPFELLIMTHLHHVLIMCILSIHIKNQNHQMEEEKYNILIKQLEIIYLFINAKWYLLNNTTTDTAIISHTMKKHACVMWNIISYLLKELSSNQLQTQPSQP